MEVEQEMEWKLAQEIVISVDLVAAAKQQPDFLAAVDRNRWLYEGPALLKAIYRYYKCWLPLVAKHSTSPFFEGPLVVPLDCEWVWHCHRLNPVQYNYDCKQLYGKIIDNHNVTSSTTGTCKGKTEQVWKQLNPSEPYELDLASALSDGQHSTMPDKLINCSSNYDLVSAVKRQSSFFYQVSRPHMSSDLYLEGAVARYKGFLHLIKRNKERSIRCFCVPTYDIDLIWHTHQLHPVSYCEDLVELIGMVLEHDDTDLDRTKGNKLDTGFSNTIKHWEETYGRRYWRAGTMYRGDAPLPLPVSHNESPPSTTVTKKVVFPHKKHHTQLHLPEKKVLEVMLEFLGLKNLPEQHTGSLFVSFSKQQSDGICSPKRRLGIRSESGKKQVAFFQCEASGNLFFELMSQAKTMGSVSVSLEELLSPTANLSMEKWLELIPHSKIEMSKPVFLRVAISVTTPTSAPYVLRMVRSSNGSSLFPLHLKDKDWTRIIDEDGDEIMSLQMRDFHECNGKPDYILRQEVIAVTKSGETRTLAEFRGTEWSLIDAELSICFQQNRDGDDDGHLFKLTGPQTVKYFPGRKLDYQPRYHEKQRSENEFLTAVEYSVENPYGKAVGMLDLKFGVIHVKQEWLVLPGAVIAFILCDILGKKGYGIFSNQDVLYDVKSNKIVCVDGG
ncbi:unnamed protein product, partial [Cuscuta europaea]